VQFAEDALPDGQVLREAWFELRVDGAEALPQKALSVGLKRAFTPPRHCVAFKRQAAGVQDLRHS